MNSWQDFFLSGEQYIDFSPVLALLWSSKFYRFVPWSFSIINCHLTTVPCEIWKAFKPAHEEPLQYTVTTQSSYHKQTTGLCVKKSFPLLIQKLTLKHLKYMYMYICSSS